MINNDPQLYPPLYKRLYGVWFRHVRVYTRHLLSNGFPPFVEPLIFLAGIGLGLGKYITDPMQGQQYIEFLSIGLLVTSSMWTAAFECSFGTFIRLEFEKVYDGMLAAPITADNLIVGEMIWAGSKGFFFSFAVLCIVSIFGVVPLPQALSAPVIGFLNALMFAALSLYITSFVKTINHFNFYMTGLLSPMFFFSGVVFPAENLPRWLLPVSEAVPLTHSVRIMRILCSGSFHPVFWADLLYMILFIGIMGALAVRRLKKRLIL
jgi:lipooligosaccharide transport system permease protein